MRPFFLAIFGIPYLILKKEEVKMEKSKCPQCGTVIMIQNEHGTLVKTRLVKIHHGKTDVKCPKCKTFVPVKL